MARTDIHRPSAIQPEDYVFVACHYTPKGGDIIDFAALRHEREIFRRHMEETGGKFSGHEHGGNCHVCGAWFIDHAIYYHRSTNSYLTIGFDCAEKMAIGDARAFRNWRTARKGAHELQSGKLKAEHILEEAELPRAWELFNILDTADDDLESRDKLLEGLHGSLRQRTQNNAYTLVDIVRNVIRYGNLSDPQGDYLHKLINDIDQAKETQAKWDAESAAAKPAPSGRVEFEGTLLSKKYVEGYYGDQLKGVVKTDDGWKVYLTIPSSAGETKVGDRIALRATLEVSDDDEKFAFGKRPYQLPLEETS